jgi:hypothetical protein
MGTVRFMVLWGRTAGMGGKYEKNKRRIPAGKAKELAKLLKSVPSNFLPKECSGITQAS